VKSADKRDETDDWPIKNLEHVVTPGDQMVLATILSKGNERGNRDLFERCRHVPNAIFDGCTARLLEEFPDYFDCFPSTDLELLVFIEELTAESLAEENGTVDQQHKVRLPDLGAAPREFDNR
jgi:hypothetical protein